MPPFIPHPPKTRIYDWKHLFISTLDSPFHLTRSVTLVSFGFSYNNCHAQFSLGIVAQISNGRNYQWDREVCNNKRNRFEKLLTAGEIKTVETAGLLLVIFNMFFVFSAGEMKAAWAIDNLFIGAMSMNPGSLMDDFEVEVVPSPWLFINNGQIDEYCTFKRRYTLHKLSDVSLSLLCASVCARTHTRTSVFVCVCVWGGGGLLVC